VDELLLLLNLWSQKLEALEHTWFKSHLVKGLKITDERGEASFNSSCIMYVDDGSCWSIL
jgi:hypothetical protein